MVRLALPLVAACAQAVSPQGPPGGIVPPMVPGLGQPIAVDSGAVSVRLTAPSFRTGQAIVATIANGLVDTIYVEDFKTDCSTATLERNEAGEWRAITGCGLERLTFVLAIGSRHARTLRIDPRSPHLRKTPDPQEPALRAGTYRLAVRYRETRGPLGHEPHAVRSEPFLIKP